MIQKFPDGDFGELAEFLRQVPYLFANLFSIFSNVPGSDCHLPFAGRKHSHQDSHEGGFSSAVGPQQAKHAGRNFQINIPQGVFTAGILLLKVRDLYLQWLFLCQICDYGFEYCFPRIRQANLQIYSAQVVRPIMGASYLTIP